MGTNRVIMTDLGLGGGESEVQMARPLCMTDSDVAVRADGRVSKGRGERLGGRRILAFAGLTQMCRSDSFTFVSDERVVAAVHLVPRSECLRKLPTRSALYDGVAALMLPLDTSEYFLDQLAGAVVRARPAREPRTLLVTRVCSGNMNGVPSGATAVCHRATQLGLTSMPAGLVLIGVKRASGRASSPIRIRSDGQMAWAILHKKILASSRWASSLRRTIDWTSSPASVPILDQTKAVGSPFMAPSLSLPGQASGAAWR